LSHSLKVIALASVSYSFTHSILQHCLPIKLYKHIYMSDKPEKLQQEASNTAVTGELTHGPPQYIHVLRHNRRTLNTDGPQRASTVPPSHERARRVPPALYTFMQSFTLRLPFYWITDWRLVIWDVYYIWPRNTKPVISSTGILANTQYNRSKWPILMPQLLGYYVKIMFHTNIL